MAVSIRCGVARARALPQPGGRNPYCSAPPPAVSAPEGLEIRATLATRISGPMLLIDFFATLIDGNLSRPLVFKADSILSQLLFVWSWPGTLKRKRSDVFLSAAVSNSLCGV